MSIYTQDFFVGRTETVVQSASVVVPVIVDLIHPQSVLDVGCGQGEWLAAFGLEDMMGVDIAYTTEESFRWVPCADYSRHDLRRSLYLDRTFDLVLCLEVGEHLPEECADTLIETIVKHGDNAVFSAAVPGQEGKGHINCKPHSYWHDKFASQGFHVFDSIRPLIQDHRVSPWYRENIFLYRRAD